MRTELVQARATRRRMVNARASTIFKLPPEILSMIFKLVCANARLGERVVDMDHMPSWRDRGSISLTCFDWRQVVLATPSLWNEVAVRIDKWDHDEEEDDWESGNLGRPWLRPYLSLVPVTLERAGLCPLNIYVAGDSYSEAQGALCSRLVSLITPVIQRARVVQITTHFLPTSMSLFSRPLLLPELRYLWLEWEHANEDDEDDEDDNDDNDDNARCIDLSNATSLRLLSIYIPHYPKETLHLQLPEAANITRLTLSGAIPFSDVLAAVTCSASQLEWIYLNIRSEGDTQLPAELHLPSLRHLFVQGLSPLALVPAIIAPQLRSLAIQDFHRTMHPIPLSNVEQFPHLHDLFVAGVPDNILIPFIKIHPRLKRLGPVNTDVARQIMLDINPESRALLLPNLRALFVEIAPGPILEEIATVRQLAEHIQTARPPNCLLYVPAVNWTSLTDTSSDELRNIADEFKKHICYPRRCRLDMNWKNVSLLK